MAINCDKTAEHVGSLLIPLEGLTLDCADANIQPV